MILSGKNAKDVTRPRRKMFGEEWFCAPGKFDHDFFGVALDGKRAQPFPTLKAARKFAKHHVNNLGVSAEILNIDGKVVEHLTPTV